MYVPVQHRLKLLTWLRDTKGRFENSRKDLVFSPDMRASVKCVNLLRGLRKDAACIKAMSDAQL